MPAPEINVRLTADGVQDVVNAFKRVQQESRVTKNELGLLGEAGQQLANLIPVVSIGLAVGKMVELGKQALDSAIDIGKLSEKTGASAGTLSVLAMAAHDVGVNQEELGTSLVKLARAQELASQGSVKQKLAFQSLGISIADIKSKDPAALFVELAQKLQQLPDGATKAAVTMVLLGRTGANLIPVLNEIGQADGFDKAKQKAQDLGLYLSDGMVADARKAEKAIADLEDVTKGFAMQFMSGFTPQMTAAVVQFSNVISDSGSGSVKLFGEEVGSALKSVVTYFTLAGIEIGAILTTVLDDVAVVAKSTGKLFEALWDGIAGSAGFAAKIMNRDFAGALEAAKNAARGVGSDLADVRQMISDAMVRQESVWGVKGSLVREGANLFADSPAENPKPKPKPTGADGDGTSAADKAKALAEFRKLVDAKAAYEDQVSNDELAKQKLRDAEANAEDKAMYDQGLISLNQYYDARAQRINQEADAEEAILKQKLASQVNAAAQLMGKDADFVKNLLGQGSQAIEAAAGNNPAALKMLQNLAATQAQIDEDEIKRQNQIFDNDQQRYAAAKAATQEELSNREKLYQLQGMTSAAQEIALEKELLDTEDLLKKLGVAEAKRQAILDRVRANAMSKNQMGALSTSGGDALSSLQNSVSDIQDRASAGAISEMEATAEIYRIEKERLPVLQQIASQMQDVLDNAEAQLLPLQKGTPEYEAQLQVVEELEKQAEAYGKQVAKISTSLQSTKSFAVAFQNLMMTQGTDALTTFFDDIGSGSKGAQQAFADLGKSFEAMIVHMIDQMIIYYTLMALVGWIAPGSSFFTSLQKAGPFGGFTGHAGGGWTGNAATNRVSGVVHGQEFVIKAGAASRYRPLLEAINAGTVGSVNSASSIPSGGAGAESGSDSGPLVQVNVDSGGNPVTQTHRQGPGGTNIIDLVIGRVASDIAGGGKVGQTIQSTYNVSRKGTRRG